MRNLKTGNLFHLGDGFGPPTGYVEGHSVLCGLFCKPFKGSLIFKGSRIPLWNVPYNVFVFLIAHVEMCFFITVGASGNPKQLD